MELSSQPVFDALYARRSVRRYQPDRPVEPEKIDLLLKAAMAAPSACNIQPWEFIVVTQPETLAQVRQHCGQFGGYNAPLIIVTCAYRDYIPWPGDDGIVDCAAAMENMHVAAPALGLGSVWIGGFDAPGLRAVLDIPANVAVSGVAYFGYPAEHPNPRTQYLDSAVYWEKYDPARQHPKRPGSLV